MGKNDSGSDATEAAIRDQTKLARELSGETKPLRTGVNNQLIDFLRGGDLTSSPEFQSMKAVGDAQFQRAQDSIISNTPEGGGLTSALTNLETQRALAETQAIGGLSAEKFNQAIQMGTFGAAQGTQGFGQAGMTASNLAAAQAQQSAGKSAGLGAAAGGYFGGK
jgi:hypothetical protein